MPCGASSRSVFADEANSTVSKIDTTSELEKAERLLAAGDIPAAKMVLDNASSPCRCGQGLAGQDRPRRALGQVDDAGPGDHVTRSAAADEWSAGRPDHFDHGNSGLLGQTAQSSGPGEPTSSTKPDPGVQLQLPPTSASSTPPTSLPTTTTTDNDHHHDDDVSGACLVAVR